MKILAVIPARGGSKGVPGKNIRSILGKPLIYYTLDCAMKSKMITDIVVSTDNEVIREIAINFGAQAPFIRPAELATDNALAIHTIQHAVREMEMRKKMKYHYIIMLQPTSPLKTAEDIDQALQKLISENADGIISVVNVDNNHPMKMKVFTKPETNSGKLIDYATPPFENCPRQLLPPVYIVNGAIYATKRDVLMNKGTFQGDYCLGFIMPAQKSINIDTEFDFLLAEYELKNRTLNTGG